jgi:hypothetical protein
MKRTLNYFISFILLLLCCTNAKAQNGSYQVFTSDTAGTHYGLTFRLANADFSDVAKIVFYKKVVDDVHPNANSTDSLTKIKEIYITKNGEYYLLVEDNQVSAIKTFFNTSFYVPKEEYSKVAYFKYKLISSNGSSKTYLFNKN